MSRCSILLGRSTPKAISVNFLLRFPAITLALFVCLSGKIWADCDDAGVIAVVLNADMSSMDAESGEAIRRGALTAMEEINQRGGVLGRSLELRIMDHRRNPARGIANVRSAAAQPDVVAILGGKHTPVVLAELPVIHELGIPYLIPWAAGTQLVDNGYVPNYVFRVSVRDADAGAFLVRYALEHHHSKLGLLLEQTGWGRSNENAIVAALAEMGKVPAAVEWFNWGQDSLVPALTRFADDKVDAIVFVGNAPDGVTLVRNVLALYPEGMAPAIYSHWGIAGGDFIQPLGDKLAQVTIRFLQTFSFHNPPYRGRVETFFSYYRSLYPEPETIEYIAVPTGVAHAYDLIHLLAKAIEIAGSCDRSQVRAGFLQIESHAGLVRDYRPPFRVGHQDALTTEDYQMAVFENGWIVPLQSLLP